MNDCEFIGNLTKDPVIRNTKTGKAVASFSIATNRDYVTPQGQKRWVTEIVASIIALPLPTHAQNQQAPQGGQQWRWGNGQQNGYNQPPQGNNYGQPCQQGQLSQVSPYQPQGNGYPQQGAAPRGNSTDWWGQFGHAVPQGSGDGKDEDIPF